ncbi:hypothetical protein FQN49_008900, partial [Arthroderma sp. PD_2]
MATAIEKVADTASADSVDQKNAATAPSNPTTQSLIDQVSLFVAHADRITLISIAAGLVAVAYVLFGRLSLLLVGAIGGVVLHIWWEGHESGIDGDNETSAKRKRQELSLEVANRLTTLYADRGPKFDVDGDPLHKLGDSVLDYSKLGPATGSALTAFTDSVIADYVNWWYKPILPSEFEFPKACRSTFVGMVLAVSSRVSRKRPADIFLQFATNSTSFMIVFFSELSAAVETATAGSTPVADSIDDYLAKNPESSLANVLSFSQQEKKLGLIGTDILETFLEPSVYNCGPLRVFLREVISRLILQTTIDMCSDADYINTWIVYFLEEGEPQLMNAIDAGLEEAGDLKQKNPSSTAASTSNVPKDKPSNVITSPGDRKSAKQGHADQVKPVSQSPGPEFAHEGAVSRSAGSEETSM